MFADGSLPATCAEYEILIEPRAGIHTVFCGNEQCAFTCDDQVAWSWARTKNEPSTATLSLAKGGCCDCVPKKWRDELSFWRLDGQGGKRRVWVGPVVDVVDDTTNDTLTITARDRSIWAWSENFVPETVTVNEAAEVRFERLFKLVDLLDPSGLIMTRIGGFGVNTSKPVALWASLQDEFALLQQLGVEWTVVGNELIFGDLDGLLTTGTLNPAVHWVGGGALVSDVGADTVTNVLIVDGESPVLYPGTLTPDPCTGLHIRKVSVGSGTTTEQATALAVRLYTRWLAGGVRVATADDSSVSENWPIAMADMRPGGSVNIQPVGDEFCLTDFATSRLQSFVVEGVGCEERFVKPFLTPDGAFLDPALALV